MADHPAKAITEAMTTFWFHDLIHDECDFIGINYYGREIISGVGIALLPSEEYSDAGRRSAACAPSCRPCSQR
jgi:hypothetical protein